MNDADQKKVARALALKRATNRRWYVNKRRRELAARPPDCLLSLTKTERAYLAGLLDGDGCFRIGHLNGKRRYYYTAILIGMTDRPTIEWVQSKWRSGTIKVNNHTALRRKPAGWRTQYTIYIHGARAKLLAKLLLPYLKTKKANAELIASFPADGRAGRGKPVAEDNHRRRFELFEAMRKLNRRGPRTAEQEGVLG